MASEQGSITLPKWFIWLTAILGAPTVLGAIPWAYSVQTNLTEINLSLQYIRGETSANAADLAQLESDMDEHFRDPGIHKYELDRLRAEIVRLTDRVDRLEERQTE